MYLPKVFAETDPTRIYDFVEAHAFGALIVPGEGGALEIAHLPFLLDRTAGMHGVLRAHVAGANPIWKKAAEGRPATVIFTGPHGYVSPRWYEKPREQVPTWNYMAVHAIGRLEAPMERADLATLVDELSAFHERDAPDTEQPWRMADLEASFREELLDAIVGFRLVVDRFGAKLKLSQNRSAEDHTRVANALEARGAPDDLAMARWMRGASK